MRVAGRAIRTLNYPDREDSVIMITHTHGGCDVVKKNRKQQAIDKKRRLFESLDRKGQAYFGLMEHSRLSMDAIAMLQYLMCKQGTKHHAFPSMREMKERFQCNHRRLKAAIAELQEALPEVFTVTKNGGQSRDSYKLTPYSQWPLAVCERLWFTVPTLGTLSDPTVGTQAPKSVSTMGTLYGNSDGDSLNGNSKETIRDKKPVKDLWASVAPLG